MNYIRLLKILVAIALIFTIIYVGYTAHVNTSDDEEK